MSTKTIGTVGPFTIKMNCTDLDPERNCSKWEHELQTVNTEVANVGSFGFADG